MHSKLPVLEAAIAMNMITTVAATRTTGPICVSGPISQCHRLDAYDHPSSCWAFHQCWSCKAGVLEGLGLHWYGLAITAKIFGFTTDFASQWGFRICQNVTMITLSVAGLLLLLNVALISSILSVDQLIGWANLFAVSPWCCWFVLY